MGVHFQNNMANETVEVYGRLRNVIGMAEIIYSRCHCPVGLILPASTVRAILHDSDLFRPDEVERWDETARTPVHINVSRWILETAREAGLAYKAAGRHAEPLEMSADSGTTSRLNGQEGVGYWKRMITKPEINAQGPTRELKLSGYI